MLMYPQIDPVALQVGPLAVHWYGLTYLAAFALFMLLGTLRLRHPPFATARTAQGTPLWTRRDVEDILFLGVLGVVLGGRLGYCLFYKPGYYLSHPLEVFFVWQVALVLQTASLIIRDLKVYASYDTFIVANQINQNTINMTSKGLVPNCKFLVLHVSRTLRTDKIGSHFFSVSARRTLRVT